MTEPIVIPIDGDARDFIAAAKQVQNEMDTLKYRLEKAGVSQAAYNKVVSEATTQNKSASLSLTDLRSAYMIVADVARVAGQVWQQTGQEFVNYAEQVKNMSRSLGASAEETSRIIQVADDVRISYSSLTVAMKTAQKNGIEPNIEGLAKLADQYKAIQSPTERTKFLLETFGKSGLEMGKLMEQGGDGVRKMSAAIDENLIITEKGIQASDEYQRALDELNDSWMAIKVTIGSYLVGPATQLLNHYRDITTSLKENGYWYTLIHQFSLDDIAAKREQADATFNAAQGSNDLTGAIEDSGRAMGDQKAAADEAEQALKDYKDQLEATSKANQDAEKFIQNYADFTKDYAEQHQEAINKVAEAEEKLRRAREKDYGKGKNAGANQDNSIADAEKGLAEAQQGVQKLEASWHESTQKMIYDMVLAKVSVDGLTDAEFKATQQLAVQMGIRTQAQADEANAMMDKASALASGIALQEDVQKEKQSTDEKMLELENAKKAAADATSQTVVSGSAAGQAAIDKLNQSIIISTKSLLDMGNQAAITAGKVSAIGGTGVAGKTNSKAVGSQVHAHASGGDFLVPASYGNEGFRLGNGDTASAGERITITPNGGGGKSGAVYNITINNPKKETTEDSLRKSLQKLSYLGVPA